MADQGGEIIGGGGDTTGGKQEESPSTATESIHAGNRVFGRNSHFASLPPFSFSPPPSPSPSPFIFRVCSCHPAEVVSRTPLCAQSTFLSGLNTSRPDYRTESNSFKIGGREPLEISFANKISCVNADRVCTPSSDILLQLFRSRSESPSSSRNSKQ